MSGLSWIRLSTTIFTHDKLLALLDERNGYRAALVYVFSLAYSGGNGTDGYITRKALPMIHGTPTVANLLVEHKLWMRADDGGWWIRNYDEYQAVNLARSEAARRAANARWEKERRLHE